MDDIVPNGSSKNSLIQVSFKNKVPYPQALSCENWCTKIWELNSMENVRQVN